LWGRTIDSKVHLQTLPLDQQLCELKQVTYPL
jgi:hypothetical protein